MLGDVITAFKTVDSVVNWLNNGNVERYGSAIRTLGDTKNKIVGHLETRKANIPSVLAATSSPNEVGTQLSNMSGMVQQLTKNSSKMLGGLTSLGWANLAVSGINLGVTAVGMVVISKKINKLSQEVQQMNGKLDSIMSEMHEIKIMVGQLNENEIRKLYSEANRQIRRMNDYADELSTNYNSSLGREVKNQLIDSSSFLDDILARYNDINCNIALGLDVIMAHFYAFVSLMKSYISALYLYDKNLQSYESYENTLRNFCSKSMIESIQNVYRQSSSSFVSPQDLGLITAVYKGIMVEQISEIKSQRQIIELVDYNEYRRINEKLQEDSSSDEIAFIQYA